jgi:Anti-sigma factor NepR
MCDGKSNDVALEARPIILNGGDSASTGHADEIRICTSPQSASSLEPWFSEQLLRLYAETLDEPLPDELLALLEQLRRNKKSTTQ